MRKKLVYFVFVFGLFLTSTANAASPNLMAYWTFDGHTLDVSGNDRHGTLNGNPMFVDGIFNQALEFDGDDYVNIDGYKGILGPNAFSIAAWVKQTAGNTGTIVAWGQLVDGARARFLLRANGQLRLSTFAGRIETDIFLSLDEWYHVAVTKVQGQDLAILYLDGQEVTSEAQSFTGLNIVADADVGIGWDPVNQGSYFTGIIDEVFIYDKELTQEEIQQIIEGGGGESYPFALGPKPADGTMIEDTWVNLSWSPGDFAITHDVYIGESFADVDSGAEGTFQGNQSTTTLTLGFPGFAYPNGLVPGTTYYWRIDEVNNTDPNSPWKGDVWSFMVPPKTAYNPDPADSAEAVEIDASLSWTLGFGAKLHTVYFGETFDEVDNAAGGSPQGAASYSPGPLKMAKTYYWRVDEFDATDTHKGNVWSFITEGAVGSPSPAEGTVDVTQTPVLTWTPGFGATHEIYFGTDPTSLELKGSGNLGSESYDPGQLEWNTTYYWRVDEANSANADSPWTGPLWSFTTANFLIIDDMESYNDINEGEPGSNRIYLAWIDGYDNPAVNGSIVGNDPPPITEQTIVHSGNQSMPMIYDNAVGKSEATLTLTDIHDWTVNGVDTLTIWFRGEAGNAAEQMYVTLNGDARVDHDDPDVATSTNWKEWNIPLQAFADQDVNLSNVNSITLGLSSVTGGTGKMYFDDIRLYSPAP
jgi:hypothetical protein